MLFDIKSIIGHAIRNLTNCKTEWQALVWLIMVGLYYFRFYAI